ARAELVEGCAYAGVDFVSDGSAGPRRRARVSRVPTEHPLMFDLSGRVAIVTGTSRGLGQYMARALARAGADLVLTSRTRESLRAFEGEIKALGRRAVALELDVRKLESIESMAMAAEKAFGRLDILVNNAGCNVRKP